VYLRNTRYWGLVVEVELSTGWSARITVDLVNTATHSGDRLRTTDDLAGFLRSNGESEPVTVDADDLSAVRALRERLRAIFETDDETQAAREVNELLDAHATRPYLSNHDGAPWHLHASPADADWAGWLGARTALALALIISDGGFRRLRRCAAGDCAVVLLDTSRNHTRRFCSPTCATRTRVAAHRARRGPVS